MSIGHIENDPLNPDTVETVDPSRDIADTGAGIADAETDYYGRARRHVDPLGTALLRLGVGRTKELDQHPGYEGLLAGDTDPDAPYRAGKLTTGTPEQPERWVHDAALQVRQVLPTNFTTQTFALDFSGPPVQIAVYRPERTRLVLRVGRVSVGELVCIARNPASLPRANTDFQNTGPYFLMESLGQTGPTELVLYGSAEVWAHTSDAGCIAVLDEFRTDNDAT